MAAKAETPRPTKGGSYVVERGALKRTAHTDNQPRPTAPAEPEKPTAPAPGGAGSDKSGEKP